VTRLFADRAFQLEKFLSIVKFTTILPPRCTCPTRLRRIIVA